LLDNSEDASFTAMRVKAGTSASQNREFRWVGFSNVTDWQDQVSSAHNRNIVDTVAGVNRLALTQGGASALNSIGATANNFNVTNGTGTGGSAFGDGAGSTTATISSAGKATYNGGLVINNIAAPTVGATQVGFGSTVASTVGAAGGASALPATPSGYLIINVAGTNFKLPYYAV
jgi:hypothetical protein